MATSNKKVLSFIVSVLLLMAMTIPLVPIAYASPDPSTPEEPGIEEDYTGVSHVDADVEFCGGNVISKCGAKIRLNYSATVTMQLKKNGSIVSTWTYTASSGQLISKSETYGAVSGSTYQVVVKVRVYDAAGQLVEIVPCNSVAAVCP